MTKYKIRSLTRGDRVAVSKMIAKVVERAGDCKLLDLISSTQESTSAKDADKKELAAARSRLGLEIVKLLMTVLNDDCTDWFASLLNVTVEEFNQMPFDIEVEIVKQLQEADEVAGFFSGASQQFRTMFASQKTSKEKKTK